MMRWRKRWAGRKAARGRIQKETNGGTMKSLLIAAGLLAAAMQTASADSTVLRFVPGQNPGTFSYDSFFVPWAKKVTDDSHGALTVDLRGGMSIANITN